MPSVREILDSEDEGGDFSPVKSVIGDDARGTDDAAVAIEQPRDEPLDRVADANIANPGSGESTDLSFFQHVYDEQRLTTSGDHSIAHTKPTAPAASDLTEPQTKTSSSLTSVTDPVPTGSKTKNTYAARDVADLTQVTTPSREAPVAEMDPWDVPSSPPACTAKGLSKVARTYGKRKREKAGEHSSSLPPTQDPYDFPGTRGADPTPKAAKRAKRGTQSSRGQPSSSAGQVEEPASTRRSPRRSGESPGFVNGSEEVIPDTAPGLYIAPSALTASQKQEYQLVSLSSEPGELSLPSMRAGEVYKSSGATTMVFSTPSGYRSSTRWAPPSDGLPGLEEVDEGSEARAEHPASSPDVISEEPVKRKRGRPQKKVPEELPPPLETRSAKKRRMVPEEEDYSPVRKSPRNNIGDGGGRGTRRGRGSDGPQDTTATENLIDLTAQAEEAPDDPEWGRDQAAADEVETENVPEPKKKRGRKKKETKVQEIPIDNTEEPGVEISKSAPTRNAPEVDDSEPPKKKRGRPRKSAAPPAVEPDNPEPNALTEPHPTSPGLASGGVPEPDSDKPTPAKVPGKRGRKKRQDTIKSLEHTTDEEEAPPPPSPAPAALSEISRNSQPPKAEEINASDDDDDDYNNDETKENAQPSLKKPEQPAETTQIKKDAAAAVEKKAVNTAKAAGAVASPASAAAATKVQYRVGLSKKSRIAPLLKSLRK